MTTIMERMGQQMAMAAAEIDIETTTTKGQIQKAVKALEHMDVRTIQGITATYTRRQEKKQEQKEKQEQKRKQKQKEKQEWEEKKRKDEGDKERERKIKSAYEAVKGQQQRLAQNAGEERKKEDDEMWTAHEWKGNRGIERLKALLERCEENAKTVGFHQTMG